MRLLRTYAIVCALAVVAAPANAEQLNRDSADDFDASSALKGAVATGFRLALPPFGTGRTYGRYYEVSLFEVPNGAMFAGSGAGPLRGLRIHEHAGAVGKFLMDMIVMYGIAASAVHVESSSHTADYGSYKVITTTTTYTQVKSDAQVANEISSWQNESADAPFTYSLEFYGPQFPGVGGDSYLTGGAWELGLTDSIPRGVPLATRALPWVFDVGMSGSTVKPTRVDRGNFREQRDLSIYGRLFVPLTPWFEAHAHLRLNFFSLVDDPADDGYISPSYFSFGGAANLSDRLFVRATVTQALFRSWNNWVGFEAGVRL